MKFLSPLTFLATLLFASFSFGQTDIEPLQVSLNEDGLLSGKVFAMLENEEAPIAGRITLTADGKTIASEDTDEIGNFSIADIKPGKYRMFGVAGEYIGDQVIEVKPFSKAEYTAVPLKLAPAFNPAAAVQDFGSAPMQTFSSAPVASGPILGGGYAPSGCGCSGGGGFGGGGLLGRGGGLNFRRLALIGGTVGLAVGLSSNNSSPDE